MRETTVIKTPVGNLKTVISDGAVTEIKFTSEPVCGEENSVTHQLREYLEGKRKTFDALLAVSGTPFQKKVWQALLDIPYGETRTYGQIAAAIGNPKAYRAVGMACNRNPICIIVPCQRVVGTNGKLVGYAEGVDKKSFLLNIEQKRG